MASANKFLEEWVPKITGSPAFKKDGLLIITLDEAEGDDTSSCCGEKTGPNTPNNGGPEPGNGGGRIGAVLLSPFIRAGTETKQEYNHYSLLRSVEDLFAVEHLGYAGQEGLVPFGDDVYTNPAGTPQALARPHLKLSGAPRHCHRGAFTAKLRAIGRGVSTLAASLDGRRLKSSAKAAFGVRVECGALKPGVHRIRGDATGAGGQSHRLFHFRRTR
jgi:hypothetical protein